MPTKKSKLQVSRKITPAKLGALAPKRPPNALMPKDKRHEGTREK